MSFLRVEALSKQYEVDGAERSILSELSFEIAQGQSVVISGPSGCGKSTLLNIIAGMQRPSAGRVLIGETCVSELSEAQRDQFRGKHIGYIVQTHNLLAGFTAADNLRIAAAVAQQSVSDDAIQAALERVGLAGRANDKPATLSLGQQQRVAIARALITQPRLILADEPSSSLDREQAIACMELLLAVATEQQAALLMVSHDERIVGLAAAHWAFADLQPQSGAAT